MENKHKWLKYDITEALKVLLRFTFLLMVVVLPSVAMVHWGESSICYIIATAIIGTVLYVFVILPKTYSKEIWKGDDTLSEYYLIRSWGKFKLIKTGVFGNYTLIEDNDKDGVPDAKTEKHFMGRFGYFNYPRTLDELDYEAFRKAIRSVA